MTITHEISNCLKSIVNLVYPDVCILCETELQFDEEYLCPGCYNAISILTPPLCTQCSTELPPFLPSRNKCSSCSSRKWYFNKCISIIRYDDTAKKIFHEIKFRKRRNILSIFSNYITQKLESFELNVNNAIIIPVPLNYNRKIERDFNQSHIIAKMVRSFYRLPCESNILKRIKQSTPQSVLNRKERLENLIGSFTVVKPYKIRNKDILLIDDVFTTGSTVNECSRVLKESGAHTITVITIARTL